MWDPRPNPSPFQGEDGPDASGPGEGESGQGAPRIRVILTQHAACSLALSAPTLGAWATKRPSASRPPHHGHFPIGVVNMMGEIQ